MKIIKLIFIFFSFIFLFSCANEQEKKLNDFSRKWVPYEYDLNNDGWNDTLPEKRYDMDLDGKYDSIIVSFSGGAHCCYSISIWLSSTKHKTHFLYEMDGGYLYGFPINNLIGDNDKDGYPEISLMVGTYNGEDTGMLEGWGIKSNYIQIEYDGSEIKVSDN